MESMPLNRRSFLGRIAALMGGLAAIPVLAQPAQAGRSRWRGGYGYGPGWGRGGSRRRYWGGGGYGYGQGYYGGGYGNPGYYRPPLYGQGYYGTPYAQPYYAPRGLYIPLSGPAKAAGNPLNLLET